MPWQAFCEAPSPLYMDVEVGTDPDSIPLASVRRYIETHGHPGATDIELEPIGDTDPTLKAVGYGHPVRVRFRAEGRGFDWVFRTMRPDRFGHDRRADRAEAMVMAFDDFPKLPAHVRPVDLGFVTPEKELASMPRGEPFLVTEYAAGEPYASDLQRLADARAPEALDILRVEALADYLAALHQTPCGRLDYIRSVRDVVGHGEGILGLVDSYPETDSVMWSARLAAWEQSAIRWRWALKAERRNAVRIHGDFHPFNVLFSGVAGLTVLDTSRGSCGDPADDLTALSINFPFFALRATGEFDGALRELWGRFWHRYVGQVDDPRLLRRVGLYFAWRTLVVISPVWYPEVREDARERLAFFAERLLDGATFDPDQLVI